MQTAPHLRESEAVAVHGNGKAVVQLDLVASDGSGSCADVLDEIAGAPVDPAAIALLVQRSQRNADQRQEACNPAKDRARKYDVTVVQDKQNSD
jgi:hypothetical protein